MELVGSAVQDRHQEVFFYSGIKWWESQAGGGGQGLRQLHGGCPGEGQETSGDQGSEAGLQEEEEEARVLEERDQGSDAAGLCWYSEEW